MKHFGANIEESRVEVFLPSEEDTEAEVLQAIYAWWRTIDVAQKVLETIVFLHDSENGLTANAYYAVLSRERLEALDQELQKLQEVSEVNPAVLGEN